MCVGNESSHPSSLGLAPHYGGYGGGGGKSSSSNGLMHRTPSTSAIYETLRRSKELRESINSRPSSRMSLRDTVSGVTKMNRGYYRVVWLPLGDPYGPGKGFVNSFVNDPLAGALVGR